VVAVLPKSVLMCVNVPTPSAEGTPEMSTVTAVDRVA
jgi:hypothetical protein